ncbi:ATP-dependent RecD-like DNA helicase [Campylobacter sp. MOP7]|uniref:ATP-dependent DNA helicase n=1 Tax=Campylobacter canis TaxID=3378588 RepID=UPI00387E5676
MKNTNQEMLVKASLASNIDESNLALLDMPHPKQTSFASTSDDGKIYGRKSGIVINTKDTTLDNEKVRYERVEAESQANVLQNVVNGTEPNGLDSGRVFSPRLAYKQLRKLKRAFLTGAGGTGKSFLVNQLRKEFQCIVLGTTGIAASNVGGETVHSFFKLGLSSTMQELEAYTNSGIETLMHSKKVDEQRAKYIYFYRMTDLLYKADCLIVDEVSMMSDQLLDMIEDRLRIAGRRDIPILFVGDMYQLPPVSKDGSAKFCFESRHWYGITMIQLTKIKRTADLEFAKIQQDVRKGVSEQRILDYIYAMEFNEVSDDTTTLFSLNRQVDEFNRSMLERIEGNTYFTEPQIVSRSTYVTDKQVQAFIDDSKIQPFKFKIGAKVLFIANNTDIGFYNGELGVILRVDMESKSVVIKSLSKPDGDVYTVPRIVFEKHQTVIDQDSRKLKMSPVLAVSAYPFKLGYAITIHKSQGMTLSEGRVDCAGIFTPEQFYVALSRFSSPAKVKVENFNPEKHIVKNEKIDAFYANSKHIDGEEWGYVKKDDTKSDKKGKKAKDGGLLIDL